MKKRFVWVLMVFLVCYSLLLPGASIPGEKQPDVMVGVKIYDYDKDLPPLFSEWKSLGINTAFISDTLAADNEFMKLAKKNDIVTFVIVPVFCSPDKPVADSLYAVSGKGEKAAAEWVHFVCPNREKYREQRIDFIKNVVNKYKPDGISIDFIRYFVYWEKVAPNARLDPLDNTCFCPLCLDKMQEELHFRFPGRLKRVKEKAAWLLKNHEKKWVEWKCRTITSMVKTIAREVRKIDPGILLNAHIVPWRAADFGEGIKEIAGQDIAAISSVVDYISPMCYSHMLKRKPPWVYSVVVDMAVQVDKRVIPSIQVTESYLKEIFSVGDFERALRESLKPPSGGVIFWNWKALAESPAKKKCLCRPRVARPGGFPAPRQHLK